MLKKNDIVELEYTGKTVEDGTEFIFDTTNEETAKKNNFFNPKVKYGKMPICIGQKQILPGIDKELEGKEEGKSYTLNFGPEDAFGKKDSKLIQLIPTNKFKSAKINPVPGLQVNIDNQMGIIRSVSGGRTLVDFNHPLSGKDVTYEVTIGQKVTDLKKRVEVLANAILQLDTEVTIEGKNATIGIPFELPEDATKLVVEKMKEVATDLDEITFKKVDMKKQ